MESKHAAQTGAAEMGPARRTISVALCTEVRSTWLGEDYRPSVRLHRRNDVNRCSTLSRCSPPGPAPPGCSARPANWRSRCWRWPFPPARARGYEVLGFLVQLPGLVMVDIAYPGIGREVAQRHIAPVMGLAHDEVCVMFPRRCKYRSHRSAHILRHRCCDTVPAQHRKTPVG